MRLVTATGLSAALALLATAAGAATPNISGVWHIRGEIRYGNVIVSGTPTCTFRQVGGSLSGECVGPNARGPLTGEISGNQVSWTWRNIPTTAVGINGETGFNGTYVSSHLIRGAMRSTAVPATGTFTQTR
jgi:hypothetical protein